MQSPKEKKLIPDGQGLDLQLQCFWFIKAQRKASLRMTKKTESRGHLHPARN